MKHNTTQASTLKTLLSIGIYLASSINTVSAKSNFDEFYNSAEHATFLQQTTGKVQRLAQQSQAAGHKLTNTELETLQQKTLINEYQLAVDKADLEYSKIDKQKLPIAPKDSITGEYYISLSSPDIGVTLPTEYGDLYANVKALRYKMVVSDLKEKANNLKKHTSSPIAKINPTGSLTTWRIDGIASDAWFIAYGNGNYIDPEVIQTGQTKAIFNHGGWIGFQAYSVGNVLSMPTTTICGQVATYKWHAIRNENLSNSGWFYQAWLPTGCASGQIVTKATGYNQSLEAKLDFD